MLEIGRLREVTFREAQEGTGKSVDLDSYDSTYLQLFIWNNELHEVVGAYRMGEVDVLGPLGKEELYTSEFYEYSSGFLEKYGQALEMGRSFIRKEYQKKPYSLLLLWKGICRYVALNPRYRYLFGAVSVSDAYSDNSRSLMAGLLIDSSEAIQAKTPAHIKLDKEVSEFCRNYDLRNQEDISCLVRSQEGDGKDVPVLVRQYMKLGGKFLSFTVDSDFGNTLDGLIVVDLKTAPEKALKMYMGDDMDAYLGKEERLIS
jgi:putative hemolysin